MGTCWFSRGPDCRSFMRFVAFGAVV